MVIIMITMRYLLALFWIGMGILHFVRPEFYIKIIPRYLPFPSFLVAFSGALEILAGILVIFEATAPLGGLLIIGLLAVFMLVHINMLVHAKDRFSEHPLWILWIRVPLQFVLAYWAWVVTFPF